MTNFSIIFTIVPFILFFLFISVLLIPTFAQQYSSNTNSLSNTSIKIASKANFENPQNDTRPPSINITYPEYPPTVTTGKLMIQGTATDSGSGIHNVSAVAHKFPFNGHY